MHVQWFNGHLPDLLWLVGYLSVALTNTRNALKTEFWAQWQTICL